MYQAVILHTIEDAQHCRKHGLYKNAQLFSANANVVYFLRYHYGLACENLFSYIDIEECLQIQKAALAAIRPLLDELDRHIAPQLNEQVDLSVRYFEPLYSFTGTLQVSICILLARMINRMLERYQWERMLIYDGELLFIGGIREFLINTFPEDRFQIVSHRACQATTTKIAGVEIGDIPQILRQPFDHLAGKVTLRQKGTSDKNILLFEPLNILRQLVKDQGEANVYVLNPWTLTGGYIHEYQLAPHVLPAGKFLNTFDIVGKEMRLALSLCYQAVQDDFCQNIIQYLQTVSAFKKYCGDTSIERVYWEVPPCRGIGALLVESLMVNLGVTVDGIQSGLMLFTGQVIESLAPAFTFSRCRRYFTQGVTAEDMLALYPDLPRSVGVIPPESKLKPDAPDTQAVYGRARVDVAVYLGPTAYFHQTGVLPANTEIQGELLDFLEAQPGMTVHILLQGTPNFVNCEMLAKLKSLKNVSIIQDFQVAAYIEKYVPKVIVINSLIPDFEDVIFEDVNIIMIKDPGFTFTARILDGLKKRIYYATDISEVKRLLQLSFDGMLAKLADDTYGSNYCNQEGLARSLTL